MNVSWDDTNNIQYYFEISRKLINSCNLDVLFSVYKNFLGITLNTKIVGACIELDKLATRLKNDYSKEPKAIDRRSILLIDIKDKLNKVSSDDKKIMSFTEYNAIMGIINSTIDVLDNSKTLTLRNALHTLITIYHTLDENKQTQSFDLNKLVMLIKKTVQNAKDNSTEITNVASIIESLTNYFIPNFYEIAQFCVNEFKESNNQKMQAVIAKLEKKLAPEVQFQFKLILLKNNLLILKNKLEMLKEKLHLLRTTLVKPV
jgi:hypothetical protein